jgi:hypothetical protein
LSGADVSSPWLVLMPVLTPVMVMVAALVLQRFERIVLASKRTLLIGPGSDISHPVLEVADDR